MINDILRWSDGLSDEGLLWVLSVFAFLAPLALFAAWSVLAGTVHALRFVCRGCRS